MKNLRYEVAAAELRLKNAGRRLKELNRRRFSSRDEKKEALQEYWANIWDDRQFLISVTGSYPGRNPERRP